MRRANLIFALIAFLVSVESYALIEEITIPRSNRNLPETKVSIEDGDTTWSMSVQDALGLVGLYRLRKADAESLLATSMKAKEYYDEIIAQGRCPNATIKSGTFGKITGYRNQIYFQVVCEKNNIMLSYYFIDKRGIRGLMKKVEWQDLNKLAKAVLAYY